MSQIPVCLFLTTKIWNIVQGKLGINTHCALNKSTFTKGTYLWKVQLS